jgi:hypothetical protein
MNGFQIAEAGHLVNVLPPVDITGGKVGCQAFSMAGYKHATIIIQVGVSAAAFTKILVKVGTATAAIGAEVANAVAIPFNLYTQETAGAAQDVLSAIQNVAAAGFTPAATDGIFYVIELDANEIEAALAGNALTGTLGLFTYVQLELTNGANSVIASAVAILSGARFAEAQSPTVTA